MEDKVFIVEQGEYSDRHIVAILNDEEEFKAFCAANKAEFNQPYDSLSAFIMPITHCEKAKQVQNVVCYEYRFEDTPDYPLFLQWTTPKVSENKKEKQIFSHPFIRYEEGKGAIKTDKMTYTIIIYLKEYNEQKALKIAADMLAVEKAKQEGI